MKRIVRFICLFFVLVTSHINASQIESLKTAAANRGEDTLKARSLYNISLLYRNENLDSSFEYCNKTLALSTKLNYSWGIANAHNGLGYVYFVRKNYAEALSEFEKYKAESEKMGSYKGIAYALNNIAAIYMEKEDYEEALANYNEALKVRTENKDEIGIAQSYNNIGTIYKDQGDYENAIKFYSSALAIFEKLSQLDEMANSNNNLGIVYWKKKDFVQAEKYFENAFGLKNRIPDKKGAGIVAQIFAAMLSEQGQFDKALAYQKRSLILFTEAGDNNRLAESYNNLGILYFKMDSSDSANSNFSRSLQLYSEMNNIKEITEVRINIARTFTQHRDYTNAEKYFNEALKGALETGNKEQQKNIYKYLSEMYSKQEKFKQAYEYEILFTQTNESLLNEANTKKITEQKKRYENDKKDQKLALLHKEDAIEKLEAKRQNMLLGFASGILALIILLVFLMYNRNKLKKEARLQAEINSQQDLAGKAVIEAEEKERKRIAGDLHDGMGQMLSAVKMNLSGLKDDILFRSYDDKDLYERTVAIVDESCKEVRTISHNMMPNVLLKSGLALAVKEFIDRIDTQQLKINLHTTGLNQRLDYPIENVLYRIIQESVNNVIKHAEANQLDIQLIRDEKEITATIEDNGKGFDINNIKTSEGMGMKNMNSRVEFLKGTFQVDSSPGKGTFIHVSIPL